LLRACCLVLFASPAALAALSPAMASAQAVQSVYLGGYYAQGRFGGHSDTTIRHFPVGYQWQGQRWGFHVWAAGLSVTGVGNVLVNIGEITRAVVGSEVTTEVGVGDVIGGVSYALAPFADWAPFIDLRLDVKLPLADEERGLGTGKLDYSVQADFSQAYGATTWFATLGRNVRGGSELFPGLRDNSFVQLGLARQLSDRASIGAFYDYRGRPAHFAEETHEIHPYVSLRLTPRWTLTTLAGRGFTDDSADYTVQAQLSYSW